MRSCQYPLVVFGGVCALHALALGSLLLRTSDAPLPVTAPSVIGVMLSAPAENTPQAPAPRTQTPVKQQKTTQPQPNTPPSERAPVSLPAEPAEQTNPESKTETSAAAPSQAVPASEPPPGPITLPRIDAAHLSNPAPGYPAISRRLGEQGKVLFDVYILPDGTVGEIRIKQSSGYRRLDDAALEAVRHWRYIPARRGNEAIPYWYVQPIVYSLNT